MRRITKSLKRKLEIRVAETMADYCEYCRDIAIRVAAGADYKEDPMEERIWKLKINGLKAPLKNCTQVIPSMQKEKVDLGSPVTLRYPNDRVERIVLDGANYNDDGVFIISYHSKMGAKLLGRQVGDAVVVNGYEVTVEKIEYPI